MPSYEIKSRFGPYDAVKWRCMRGGVVSLHWPKIEKVNSTSQAVNWLILEVEQLPRIYSDCPNLHYRPWLEKYVGKEGCDWMWRHKVGCGVFISPDYHRRHDRLEIKLRKNKSKWASLLLLKWGSNEQAN